MNDTGLTPTLTAPPVAVGPRRVRPDRLRLVTTLTASPIVAHTHYFPAPGFLN